MADCPDLELVLPARKETVENDFLKDMRAAARLAVYRAMAADPSPRPAFEDWTRARAAGIEIAPPPALLRPWRPSVANVDDWRDPPKLVATDQDALVMDCDPEPPEAQALWRAAERDGFAPRLLEADRRLEGYGWYDGLNRMAAISVLAAAGGDWIGIADWPLPERAHPAAARMPSRPAAIRIELTVRPAAGPSATLDMPAEVAFAGEAWCHVDDALPLVTADSALQPHELAELLRAAFFSPSDEADSDSYETQSDRFDEEALHLATRLLLSDDEACRQSIADAVRRTLIWFCPQDRTVEISVRRPDVHGDHRGSPTAFVVTTAPGPASRGGGAGSSGAPRGRGGGAFRPARPFPSHGDRPCPTPRFRPPRPTCRRCTRWIRAGAESLSPMFAAFLCWLLGTDPMTRPAITGISIADNSVLAATTDSPFF